MSLHTGFGFQKKQYYFLKTKKQMWFVVQQKKEFWSQPKLDVNLSLSHTNSETFTKLLKFSEFLRKANSFQCARCSAKHFTGYFFKVATVIPFYSWGNWGLEKLRHLSKDAAQWTPKPTLNHQVTLHDNTCLVKMLWRLSTILQVLSGIP